MHESCPFGSRLCSPWCSQLLGLLLGETGVERALLATTVLLVLPVELLNSAIEAVIELRSPRPQPAGRAKDMARLRFS